MNVRLPGLASYPGDGSARGYDELQLLSDIDYFNGANDCCSRIVNGAAAWQVVSHDSR